MITATVETIHGGSTLELYFNSKIDFERFALRLRSFPNSTRLVHGWGRSIMLKDITRVISVEEEN